MPYLLPNEVYDATALQRALAGQYSIDREIGRGGMGIVFLAREVILDRLVAIKVLPPELAAHGDSGERFLREARTAAKLFHPHIVPIHRVDNVDGVVFIAMGYVDGQSAGQLVAQHGALPISQATRILRETAWALSYAHARGVIHRDVKPDNLLIERESNRTFVTDFGIAQVEGMSSVTRENQMFGSASYMSPEQIGGSSLDGRSDLYSLGIVAHYLLTGKVPFAHTSATAVLAMHLNTPAPPIASILSAIPPKLAAAIDKCLEKNPDDRHQSVEAFAAALTDLERRKEIPPVLRAWLAGTGMVDAGFWAVALVATLTVVTAEGGWGWAAFGAPLLYVAVQRMRQTRRLMRMGYGLDDLRDGLAAEVDEETEEIASQLTPQTPPLVRALRAIAGVSLGTGIAMVLWQIAVSIYGYEKFFGLSERMANLILIMPFTVMIASGVVWVVTRVAAEIISPSSAPMSMKQRELHWRERFWNSAIGERFARFLRTGLGAVSNVRRDQPTELVVGAAATALFDALPVALRREMAELPGVVMGLEQRASRLRAKIHDLEHMAAQVRPSAAVRQGGVASPTIQSPEFDARRATIDEDLHASRKRAEKQLGVAVAALETIRLDLLRVHAGNEGMHDLTANVDAAARLAAEIDRALEGRESVERMLKRGRNVPNASINSSGSRPKSGS